MLLSEMEDAWGRDEGWLAVPDETRGHEQDEAEDGDGDREGGVRRGSAPRGAVGRPSAAGGTASLTLCSLGRKGRRADSRRRRQGTRAPSGPGPQIGRSHGIPAVRQRTRCTRGEGFRPLACTAEWCMGGAGVGRHSEGGRDRRETRSPWRRRARGGGLQPEGQQRQLAAGGGGGGGKGGLRKGRAMGE